jgi:hypothetical protein
VRGATLDIKRRDAQTEGRGQVAGFGNRQLEDRSATRQLGHSSKEDWLSQMDLALALDEQNFARVSVPSRARDAEGLARQRHRRG